MYNDNDSHANLQALALNAFGSFLNPENYLIGAEAEHRHNELIYLARQGIAGQAHHDWLIIDGARGKKVFYRGLIGADGIFRGRRTKLKGNQRIAVGPLLTGDEIRAIAEKRGNGVWYIPAAPFELPKAANCPAQNLLTAEWDTKDPDPNNWVWLTVLAEFKQRGMAPNSITASGGKCDGLSPHAQWFFNQTIESQTLAYMQEVLTLLGADPGSVKKRMSQFRKPGFFRHSKGKWQGLFKATHSNFVDGAEWINVAIQIGADLGITIPSPQDWAKEQAEKAEKYAAQTPENLAGIPQTEIEKLLGEIDQQAPSYSPGNNTYPYRLKLASAILSLVGERWLALCPNILQGASFGKLKPNLSPLGTIVNQMRLLLGNPEWKLPDWWQKKQLQQRKKVKAEKDLQKLREKIEKQYQRYCKPKGFGKITPEGEIFKGERQEAWLKAVERGQAILDQSLTGEGKSFATVGLINPLGGKIWLAYGDHRNPTIDAIKTEYVDLNPRSQYGFYRDEQGKLRVATSQTPADQKVADGNCIRGDLFPMLTNLGYDPNDGGGNNPICQSCSMAHVCTHASGWYRAERREVLENATHIRCHIDSMPRDWDYSKDIIIIEEPTAQITPTRTITASWQELLADADGYRESLEDPQWQTLDKLLQTLKPFFQSAPYHGWEHNQILEKLEEAKGEELEALAQRIGELSRDLNNLFKKAERESATENLTPEERKKWGAALKALNAQMEREAREESENNLEHLPPNSITYLLALLTNQEGSAGIALQITKGNLITTVDRRKDYQFLEQAGGLILLDASTNCEKMQRITGLQRPIKTLRSDAPPLSNLKIKAIEIEGIGSRDISTTAVNRLKYLTEKFSDQPIIAPKGWKDTVGDIDGWWFNHNRGCNDFAGVPELMAIGLPNVNIGAFRAELIALSGSDDNWEEEYRIRQNEEIFQLVGRQRANRFPDQEFIINLIIPHGTDLTWLETYGANVEAVDAMAINPELGDSQQVARFTLLKTIQELRQAGMQKISQKHVADKIGTTQQAVSKLLKKANVTIEKLLESLDCLVFGENTTPPYKAPLRPGCDPHTVLLENFAWFLNLSPEKLINQVLTMIHRLGWEKVLEHLSKQPKALRAKVFGTLYAILTYLEPSTPAESG